MRVSKVICIAPEFDDLARITGLLVTTERDMDQINVIKPSERANLRAELDGLIAHLYRLSETEFAHILTTFPLVAEPVKVAALNAYRDVERGLIK